MLLCDIKSRSDAWLGELDRRLRRRWINCKPIALMLCIVSDLRDWRLFLLTYSPHLKQVDAWWLWHLLRFAECPVGRGGIESTGNCEVRLVQNPKRNSDPKSIEEEQVNPAVMHTVSRRCSAKAQSVTGS